MLGYISVSRAHSFRRKNMTWIKWLLRFLPVGFAIFGVLFVRHRIKLNYSTFRIVESIIVTIIACAIPIVYEKTANDLSSDTMISAPASIPNITYGQAIEAACTDVNWGYFNSFSNKDGQHLIVEVNAKYTYRDVENDITIQFNYPDSYAPISDIDVNSPMEVSFLGFGKSQEEQESTMKEILFTMFQKYASQNGITLDETQKEDILYNQAYKEKYNSHSSDEATATPEVTEEPTSEDATTSSEDSTQKKDEDYYVQLIKTATPTDYLDKTYGEAFEDFFNNPHWAYVEMDGEQIIDFTGQCTYDGEDVNCEIMFKLDMQEGTFEVKYYEFDGNEQDLNDWPSILDTIFTS